MNKLEELKKWDEAPGWMTEEGFETLSRGYLLPNESPRGMYERLAKAAASYYNNDSVLENKFFSYMWNNWLCPASPVASNMGADRGLNISCNSIYVPDSVNGIFQKNHELAMLSKNGAGVSLYLGDLRGRGAGIAGNGYSEGVVPWCKVFDTTTQVISQGSTRRGATAAYLPIDHTDIDEFMNIRRPVGDTNRRCLNLNNAVCISDNWMNDLLDGKERNRHVWKELLTARVETGQPYMFFTDTVNKMVPDCYRANHLWVSASNLCCLAGDTKVLTRKGIFPIDSLVGESVELWDGENWVLNNTISKRGEDMLFRITLSDGSYVDSNSKHRWFAASSYTDIRDSKFPEVTTKDLKVGQWIESQSAVVEGNIHVDGAYLRGFLVGDGTSHDGKPLLNLHSTKYSCIEKLVQSAAELESDINNSYRSDCIKVPSFADERIYTDNGAYGKQETRSMRGLASRRQQLLCWATSYKQDLPQEIFSWTKQSKLEFLAGLADSDGTLGRHWSLQISSRHLNFIKSLQLLVKSLGAKANVDSGMASGGILHRLTISSYDAYNLLKEMPVQRLKCSYPKPNRKCSGWRRIVSIVKLKGLHPVYCPTVPTTGKFALANGLMTGNSEIMLHSDEDHTYVCCLSSVNLTKYYEWKNTDLIEVSTRFLDAVLSEYIEKSEHKPGLEPSRRSAIKGRALGLGVLGWHTLLQNQGIVFDSFDAMKLNAEIFKLMKDRSHSESRVLAQQLGEPEWCKGFGMRNTHTLAVAPTVSNSAISGGHSAGIEPIAANIFSSKSAKGTFIRKNTTLQAILANLGKDTPEVWRSITSQSGSVQHLDFLTQDTKKVFLTAREINQHAIIKQAAQRQQFIDQGQSVNLFFASNSDPKYIHEVHLSAWEMGLKSLYYLRTEGVLKGDLASRSKDECAACEG